jgi:hypothetical protein
MPVLPFCVFMADYRVKFTVTTSLVFVRSVCLLASLTAIVWMSGKQDKSVTGLSEVEWTALSVIRSMRWAGHVACLG